MPLSGHSSDLSLADLVQANIYGRNTCRVMVATQEGQGVFYISDGAIVDATYGDLVGIDAFCALVTSDNTHFRVDSGLRSPARTINADWQGLLLDAMRMRDEGRLPKPHWVSASPISAPPTPQIPPATGTRQTSAAEPSLPTGTEALRDASSAVRRVHTQPRTGATGSAPRRSRAGVFIAVPVIIAALVMGGYLTLGRHTGEAQETATPADPGAIQTVEASELRRTGDAQPKLLSGQPPRSPNTSLAVAPTVVCRILVDEKGNVTEARIFRSRLELASFEDAAIEAVKKYRFAPGTRAGRPVRVWINWPVSFQ